MKFTFVLSAVFSTLCCFSTLNVGFNTNGQKSDVFYEEKISLLENTLTDEEVLRCQNFLDKNVKELNQKPTDEELQDILTECRLFLQQNSKLLRNKDENDSTRLRPFENYKSQEPHFYIEQHSTTESSKNMNGKNTGSSHISRLVPVTEQSESYATKTDTDKLGNKTKSDSIIPNSTNTGWNLWNYFFGASGSSENSNTVPITKQNESNSRGKPTDKPRNQKSVPNSTVLTSTDTIRNLWNQLFGASETGKSSNEKGSFKNLENSPTTEWNISFKNTTDVEYLATETGNAWNLIMPGTKWCGAGSIAAHDDDLGYFEDVDRCCRTHDKCSDIIVPGETKYNLTNTSHFTVLNCKCDDELYECLSRIDSVASNTVGNTFFNIFGRMCYTLDYPRKCNNHNLKECLEYVIDRKVEKVFQWKPAKKYLKMPFTIPG